MNWIVCQFLSGPISKNCIHSAEGNEAQAPQLDKLNPTDTDVTTVTKLCQNGAMNLATSRLVHKKARLSIWALT